MAQLSAVKLGVEENVLGDEFVDKYMPPIARTYTSAGNVVKGVPDSFSRKGDSSPKFPSSKAPTTKTTTTTTTREVVEGDFSQFPIPEGLPEKEPDEIDEDEPLEIQRRAKERWNAARNLFLGKENPDEKAEDMCGIWVTCLPSEGGGYSIKMANTNSLQRVVLAATKKRMVRAQTKATADFDFGTSENLVIQDLKIPQIEVTGPLKCSVSLAPGEVVALKLLKVDESDDVAMGMSVAPGAKTETKELKSGVMMSTTTLSQCRGVDLSFENPTDNEQSYEFDFSKAENLSLQPSVNGADESVAVSGMVATVTIPPKSGQINFVSLRTIDRDQRIKLHYAMSDAVKTTKETLKCGVQLFTHPLPKRGGYMLQLLSDTDKTLSLQFDFSGCKNLKVRGGAETSVDGYKARAQIAKGQNIKPFVLLTVEAPNQGMIMKYSMTHTVVG